MEISREKIAKQAANIKECIHTYTLIKLNTLLQNCNQPY